MAGKVELTTETDAKAYAEQVVAEVAAERAGENVGKTDAQIVAEQSTAKKPVENETTTAETPSGDDDTAEVKGKTEDQGETEEAGKEEASWLDDNLKAEVAAYGIDEKELADFASREELERALRLFDKSALEAGRKALAESDGKGEKSRNEKGQFVKKEEPKDDPKDEPSRREGRYEIGLDKELFDENLIGELEKIRDHYDSRLEALEARFHEADARAEEERFDNAIDKLNMPKLFGTTGKETPDELKKREAVLAQAKVLQAGFRTFGRDVEMESLVLRAAPMVFSEEFDKHKLKQRTRKIFKQSNGRQGGGVTRPSDPREDPRAEADRLYRELERA